MNLFALMAVMLAFLTGQGFEHQGFEHQGLEHQGLDPWKCVIFRRLACLLLFIC